jgi:uncharacterized protein YhaN
MLGLPVSQRFVYNAAIMEALKVRRQMDSWNDDRLDELAQGTKEGFAKVDARFDKVDARFDKVDARFEKVEGEMKEGFAKVEGKMEAGFAELRAANERLYRMLLGSAVVLIAALIGVPALGG